jgi:hypothetical protein
MQTTEYVNGRPVTVDASFRQYGNPQDSSRDWWNLMNQKRYSQVIGAPDFETAARAVASAGYATDPAYSEKLLGLRPNTPEQQDFADARKRELLAIGVPPQLAELGWRQSALESRWGKSAPGGNYYGIKGPADKRTGMAMAYEELPDITLQSPFSGGQEPPLGPQPLGGIPGLPPQLPGGVAAQPEPQARGFMDNLMGDPMFNIGLGILAAPGYGGNWLRGAASGAQQGLLAYQQRQKFEEEMGALQAKKREREEIKKLAASLPEPLRSLVKANPDAYGELMVKMLSPTEAPSSIREVEALVQMGIPRAQAMQMVFEKGKTTVNVGGTGQMGQVPSGHARVADVESPTGTRIIPEPGGEEYVKRQQAADQAASAVENARKMIGLIEQYGSEGVPFLSNQEASGQMDLLYGQILSNIAQLRDMGVLQPGEVALLQSQLANPAKMSSYGITNARMLAQYRELLRQLEGRMGRLQSVVPGKEGAKPEAEPPPEGVDPAKWQQLQQLRKETGGL